MTAQGVNITVQDGGLGQSVPGQGQTEVVIGVSSAGTAFQPVTSSNPTIFPSTFGYGPGPDAAAFITSQTGNPVTFVKVPNASAGVVTSVYAASTNTGSGTFTISGTPYDDYYVVVGYEQAVPGSPVAFGTAGITVTVSLDGGATIYQTSAMQTNTTLAITNTGLTLNFSGTPDNGDSSYFVATAPTWSDAAVASAIQAAASIKSNEFEDIIVTGVSGGSDVTAFDGYMTTLANTNKRWSRLLCAARDIVWGGASTETEAQWVTSLANAFASTSSLRVGVTGGHYRSISPLYNSSQLRRPLLWFAAARDSAVAIQVDLGEVDLGSLSNLVLPTSPDKFGNGTFVYHDESQNPGLDAARLMAAWQIVGLPGVFIMNPNLMAPPGSDFNWLQHGHVIDEACSIAYGYFIQRLSSYVRVSAKTGFILPQDQAKLQAGCQNLLNVNLVNVGAVSAATCIVSGTDNILSTATITVTIKIVPLGYIKAVNVTITFVNPAVQVVQNAA